MKNNHGFTLIEILIVTVLAVLLTLYTVPKIFTMLDTSKKEVYQVQVNALEKGSKDYFIKNAGQLPTSSKDARFLSIQTLVKQNLIDSEDVVDPRTNKKMNGCVVVTLENKNVQYEYVEKSCSKAAEKHMPTLTVSDHSKEVEVGSTYTFPHVTAKDILGKSLSVTGPYINGELVTSIDTSKVGLSFELEYRAYDEMRHITGEKIVSVKVTDHEPPVLKVNGKTKSFTYDQPLTRSSLEQFNVLCTDNSGKKPSLKVTSTVSKLKGKGTIRYVAKDEEGNIAVLVVTVHITDTKSPMILKVDGNRSTISNQPVTLSVPLVDYLGDSLEYSFDGGETWQQESSKEFNTNTTAVIISRDMFGNTSRPWLEEITTIDTTAPSIPNVLIQTGSWQGSEYKESWVNKALYLQVISTDQSPIDTYEYSVDGQTFKKMKDRMILTENMNQVYFFRSTDIAGNISEVSRGYKIQIDQQKISPPSIELRTNSGKILQVDKKVWVGGDIEISRIFTPKEQGSPLKQYEVSTDDKVTFDVASENYHFDQNTKEIYYFRSVDEAGNKSEWTKPVYIYIDRVRPSTPQVTLKQNNKKGKTYVSGTMVSHPIYMKVTSVDSGSGIDYYQMSMDGVSWTDLESNTYTFKDEINQTIFIRSIDKVGNVSLPYEVNIHIAK